LQRGAGRAIIKSAGDRGTDMELPSKRKKIKMGEGRKKQKRITPMQTKQKEDGPGGGKPK